MVERGERKGEEGMIGREGMGKGKGEEGNAKRE